MDVNGAYKFETQLDLELYHKLHSQHSNRYSQFGEDGIVRALTETIGVTNKWCLEVGAADGMFCSNTRQFVEDGWTAVLIERDEKEYKKLIENATETCICKNVSIEPNGVNSLDSILAELKAPCHFELMSLDIDGDDYYIWNSMIVYRPKIVIVEHSRKMTDDDYVPPYGTDEQAGYNAIIKLGAAKGYSIVDVVGHNLIFVDRTYLKNKNSSKGTKGKKMVTETKESIKANEKVRWNLGAGDSPIDGYVNIDRKTGQEVYPLSAEADSIDEIRASHILEHFDYAKDAEHLKVLADWYRALKPGGVMKIAVPDARKICQEYIDGKQINLVGYLMGGHTDDNDYHKIIYDEPTLRKCMESVGLINIEPWVSVTQDCASLPISLNLMGYKPNGEVKSFSTVNVQPAEDEKSNIVTERLELSKIGAVMSMPRLTFTDNMFCSMQCFAPLGINIRQGVGVFWGQILTRSIEQVIDEGKEFIVTVDYDTYFTKEQFLYLYYLITQNPDIAAIVPVQVKREGECALAGLVPSGEIDGDKDHPPMDSSRFAEPLTQIVTGHFGLTILRVKALKELSKPWFLGVPNKDGDWGKNRLDEDIYFWNKLYEENKKAFMANYCKIGHMQLMCTYPDTLENGWKPIHRYVTDVRKEGLPEHCIPKLTLPKGK